MLVQYFLMESHFLSTNLGTILVWMGNQSWAPTAEKQKFSSKISINKVKIFFKYLQSSMSSRKIP